MSRQQRVCRQPHGTVARHQAGCSCLPCCDAWAAYQYEWKRDTPRLIDAALVPARSTLRMIERLRKHHSLAAIARECGVSVKSLPQPKQHSVQARTAKRIKEASARLRRAS
jgi:hypothetical protein